MPRSRSRGKFRTQPVREATLIVAVVLWLVGFAAAILGAIDLPANWGVYALALAGLILIVGSLVDGL